MFSEFSLTWPLGALKSIQKIESAPSKPLSMIFSGLDFGPCVISVLTFSTHLSLPLASFFDFFWFSLLLQTALEEHASGQSCFFSTESYRHGDRGYGRADVMAPNQSRIENLWILYDARIGSCNSHLIQRLLGIECFIQGLLHNFRSFVSLHFAL